MNRNEEVFEGGSSESNNEYRLEATAVHTQFTQLVERHLEAALAAEGLTQEEFSSLCTNLNGSEEHSDAVEAFLQMVLGATDFAVFGDIMRDGQKRRYYFQILDMWRSSQASGDVRHSKK